jgi:hypothetical protein
MTMGQSRRPSLRPLEEGNIETIIKKAGCGDYGECLAMKWSTTWREFFIVRKPIK